MTSTRAAVVETGGAPFTLSGVELDELRGNEVLIRMTAAGLCHTDLGAASGGLPFPLPGVLGHEGAGIVEQVGSAVTCRAAGRSRHLVVHILRNVPELPGRAPGILRNLAALEPDRRDAT
jgi:Zn-dependent alcohol dehydrogenase